MEFGISRRRFLQATGGAFTAGPSILSQAHGRSPNETVNHAVIGTGRQGSGHVRRFDGTANCRVVAVCDVDPESLAKAARTPKDQAKLKRYTDYRRLLEDPSIDSVSVVTCDHWHTPIALAAILAGKHVYVEKPCSHNIHEANLLVQCAREHGKCVQHGTQRRSSGDDIAGVQALKEGIIGDMFLAKAINHQLRKKIGRAPEEPPPPGVDYDMWLGPAPRHAFTRNRWHYNWHWFWDYGGGDLMNDGIHQLDQAIWGMGLDRQYPEAILTSGGQMWYDDDHETPDTQLVVYEYPGRQIIYEQRLWTDYKLEGHDNGTIFYGTEGKLEFGRQGVVATIGEGTRKIKAADYGIETENIIGNFLSSVRNDDPSMLNSPVETGAVSAILSCLGNIGVRCGGIKLTYDPGIEKINKASDNQGRANELISREYRKGYELIYQG